ncbi:MAG: hypothetical protein II846_02960 [Acetobacter sp.]|nr:hypothetical protein [Acetobacter sp.]
MIDPLTTLKTVNEALKLAKIVLDDRDKKKLAECIQELLACNEVLVSGSETLVGSP